TRASARTSTSRSSTSVRSWSCCSMSDRRWAWCGSGSRRPPMSWVGSSTRSTGRRRVIRRPRSFRRSPTTISTTCSTTDVLHHLQLAGDQLQNRLLRPGAVRQDHKPPIHLRKNQSGGQGQDDLARDRDRAHLVLRLPAALAGRDPRLSHPFSPVHGAGSGVL